MTAAILATPAARVHPRRQRRYRVPFPIWTKPVISVDADLDLLALHRLNSLPPLVVRSTCAGHPEGAAILLTVADAAPGLLVRIFRLVEDDRVAARLLDVPRVFAPEDELALRLRPRREPAGAGWFGHAVEQLERALRGSVRTPQEVQRDCARLRAARRTSTQH
jgi:hypothetical protein